MKKIRVPIFYLSFIAICFAACTSKEKEVAEETHLLRELIPVDSATQYIANYAPHAGTAVSFIDTVIKGDSVKLRIETQNSRAIWFSLKQLKAFVKRLEKEKGDGVRFYFATYNKYYPKNAIDTPKKAYWGHNTLIMVSTKRDSIGKRIIHQDYYVPTGGYKPKDYSKGFIVGNPPENRGEMCPPPKACDSVGAELIDPSKAVH